VGDTAGVTQDVGSDPTVGLLFVAMRSAVLPGFIRRDSISLDWGVLGFDAGRS
jgi:hypothetical protein